MACEIDCSFGEDDDKRIMLSAMIHQTDMLAPSEAKSYFKTEECKPNLAAIVEKTFEELAIPSGDYLCYRTSALVVQDH